MSRKLLLPQLLSSPALGKSNHVEFYLVGREVDKLTYQSTVTDYYSLQKLVFVQLLLELPLCGVISIWPNPHVLGILQLQRRLGSYVPKRLSDPTRHGPPTIIWHLVHLEFQILSIPNHLCAVYVRVYHKCTYTGTLYKYVHAQQDLSIPSPRNQNGSLGTLL